jgi:NADH-quinone oxidoreductase subunit L
MTHAFFKSLLFLGAGSVIQAARHEQEMLEFGGLLRKIPVTAVTFLVGVLAISGVFGFSGYYSKEMVLAHTAAFADLAIHLGRSHSYRLLYVVPVLVAYLTPFYMMRCWMLTFWGKPRQLRLFAKAREFPSMFGPLIVLAILAVLSGRLMSIQEMLEASVQENNTYCRRYDPNFTGFDAIWPADSPTDKGLDTALTASQLSHVAGVATLNRDLGLFAPLLGILLAIGLYYQGPGLAERMLRIPPIRWVRTWLYERMYFDELYFGLLVSTVSMASSLAAWIDDAVIDRLVNSLAGWVRRSAAVAAVVDHQLLDGAVTGVGALASGVGDAARGAQTGRIRLYVTALVSAAAVAIAVAVVVALSQ